MGGGVRIVCIRNWETGLLWAMWRRGLHCMHLTALTRLHQRSILEIPEEDQVSKYCSQGAPVVATVNHGIERFNAGPIFSKCESNPDTARKRLVLLADSVYVALLFAYLGVLGHILGRGKIVVISGVFVGVEGRNKWCRCAAKILPWRSFVKGMSAHCVESAISHTCVRDQSVGPKCQGKHYDVSGGDLHLVMASQATSVRLKIRSSGLSYSGRRRTLVQFLRLVHVSSGVPPLNGGKPARNSNRIHPNDQ